MGLPLPRGLQVGNVEGGVARESYDNPGEGRESEDRSGFLAEDHGELGFTGGGGIYEGGAGAVGFGGLKEEAVLHAVGKAGEAGFAVGVGADFEIEFACVHESVRDVDFDFGGIDGRIGFVGDGEVDGALADAAVDDWDGVRVGGLSSEGKREQERKEDGESEVAHDFLGYLKSCDAGERAGSSLRPKSAKA